MTASISKVGRGCAFAGLAALLWLSAPRSAGSFAVVGPPNDNFANRIILSGSSVSVAGSTINSGGPELGEIDLSSPCNSVWYSWTAPASGSATFNTAGSNWDTFIGLYTGAGFPLTLLASDDDGLGYPPGMSQIVWPVTAGTTYHIQVDGFSSYTSNFILNISGPVAVTPPNDNFANRIVIPVGGGTVTGTNNLATSQAGEPNPAGVSGPRSVWWSWSPGAGLARIDTFGSGFDTTLGVYTGTSESTLTLVAENDDFGGPQSQILLATTAGTEYVILVNGKAGASGSVTLTATLQSPTESLTTLISQVNGDVTGALLSTAYGNMLNQVLVCAQQRIAQGRAAAAITLLRTFIPYVQRSTLPASEKTRLINETNAILAQLSAP